MNIIEMAEKAGMTPMKIFGATKFIEVWTPDLEAFATLVAAHEREAIMKSIEELRPVENNPLLQNKPAAFWVENFRQIVYARGTT